MNNFFFKLKPSGKEWVVFGISVGALVLAVLAFLGALFSLGTFFVQKELPWQVNTSWFSNDLALKNLNKLDLVQTGPNNLQNLQDQVAVLASELEAVKANDLKNQELQNQSANNTDLASVAMAKMDLHLALSELQEGGNFKLTLGFLTHAEQELLLGHRVFESKSVGSVIERLKSNEADFNNFIGLKNNQKNNQTNLIDLTNLIKNLGALSFALPIDFKKDAVQSSNLRNPGQMDSSSQPQESIWQSGLRQSWDRVKSLLIIRENQTVGENLLLDSAREAVTASIVFDLQQAESLLAARQWVSYEQVLDQVSAQIQVNFQDNAQSQSWLEDLNVLKITPVLAEKTAIQASILKILDDLNADVPDGVINGVSNGASE